MENNIITFIGFNIRKLIHPLMYNIFSLINKNLNIRNDNKYSGTVLFVGNHVGIDDIPILAQAVKNHTYFLVSDEDKYTLNGLGLTLNGVIWIKRTNKEDRAKTSQIVCDFLKHGYCVAMYPEATWNLSPNNLVLPLNWGCIKIALQSKVPIVPVTTLFKGNTSYTHIGLPFNPSENAKKSTDDLRDIMATMLYEQLQQYYQDHKNDHNIYSIKINNQVYYYEKRSEIPTDFWSENIHKRYIKYKRSKKNPLAVRIYESQFIFENKDESYRFFQIWNSSIRLDKNGNMFIRRISSERNGYCESEWLESFEYGYNEKYRQLLN